MDDPLPKINPRPPVHLAVLSRPIEIREILSDRLNLRRLVIPPIYRVLERRRIIWHWCKHQQIATAVLADDDKVRPKMVPFSH